MSVNLTNIENKLNLPPTVIREVEKELLSLRRSDVLTKNKLARVASIQPMIAEEILIELYKEEKLKLLIRVPCQNEEPHYSFYNSLEEYYFQNTNLKCPDCGLSYDWKKAVVGFMRGYFGD